MDAFIGDIEGFLLGMAQIAVALAGFSGLVVAIRGSSGWHPRDMWSLAWMLTSSMGALFLSLLPAALPYFGVSVSGAWRLSEIVMAVYLVSVALWMRAYDRTLGRRGFPARVPFFPGLASVLFLVSGLACAASGSGLWAASSVGPFLLGLLACLLTAALALAVFVVILARGMHDAQPDEEAPLT